MPYSTILPFHQELDAAEETRRGADRLGTTLRGVGPAYRDKAARLGIRVGDLFHEETLRRRIEANLRHTNPILASHGKSPVDAADLHRRLREIALLLQPHVADTVVRVNEALDRGERVLFEGAQGTLLDLDLGSYPYVTSSHPTAGGACVGAGVGPSRIDRVLGVTKAYSTRVGDGPFPSEVEGPLAEQLRQKGREFGTTTGRPRRCGWLDAVVLRHAVLVNGLWGLCVTKLDTLSGLEHIRIAVGYRINGRSVEHLPHDADDLAACEPQYEDLPGWQGELGALRTRDDLPTEARKYLACIEDLAGRPVAMVSVGAERAQTIAWQDVFAH